MSWKGLISQMSDEFLITLETVVSFCIDFQTVMQKFTLAEKTCFVREGQEYLSPAERKEIAEIVKLRIKTESRCYIKE